MTVLQKYTYTVSYVSLSRDVMQLVMNTCHIIGVTFQGEENAFNSKNYYLPIPLHYSHFFTHMYFSVQVFSPY